MTAYFFLLADMPSPTRDELSSWVVVLVSVLGALYFLTSIAANIIKMREKPTKSEEMFVTEQKLQTEMKNAKEEMVNKFSKVENTLSECATKNEVKELRDYTSKSFHELRADLNPIALKLEAVRVFMEMQKEQMAETLRSFREQNGQMLQSMNSLGAVTADLRNSMSGANSNRDRGSKG